MNLYDIAGDSGLAGKTAVKTGCHTDRVAVLAVCIVSQRTGIALSAYFSGVFCHNTVADLPFVGNILSLFRNNARKLMADYKLAGCFRRGKAACVQMAVSAADTACF